jgi:two-component system, NtrC family, response regulator HydG
LKFIIFQEYSHQLIVPVNLQPSDGFDYFKLRPCRPPKTVISAVININFIYGKHMRTNILLVDDNEDFLDSTKDVLEVEGYRVVTASNGEDAIALAGSQHFNLILMDIKMPGINGVESFLKMKAQNPDVRVILVTAYSLDDLISRAQAEGVLAILPKPLDMPKLLKTIATVLQNNKGGCILLADDDPDFCGSLSDVLEEAGYKVTTTCDSNQVPRIAASKRIDILLLDMQFPPHNGLEIYRQIKRIQPEIITIIVTGHAAEMDTQINQALDESVYTFLTKPLEMKKLFKIIQEVLYSKECGEIRKPVKRKP